MEVFKGASKFHYSIHLNLCKDGNEKLMCEILEEIRHSQYSNFSFHVVSKYCQAYYPRGANMTINAFVWDET